MAEISTKKRVKIAIVGDVHYDWKTESDIRALQYLKPDLVLFVGDFGNESVTVVTGIKETPLPKAFIMGNHDAWHGLRLPQDSGKRDRVRKQLDILGEEQVGYARKEFPELNLTVVGSRPFSWGGDKWRNDIGALYPIRNFKESAQRIVAEAMSAPPEHSLIFLGHNGPSGLGSEPHNICGRDWPHKGKIVGGDHGDIDLRMALDEVAASGRHISAVVFGHMHHLLFSSTDTKPLYRDMYVRDRNSGTAFVNGAVVPRIRPYVTAEHEGTNDCENVDTLHHFTVVELFDGKVEKVEDVWIRAGLEVSVWSTLLREPKET